MGQRIALWQRPGLETTAGDHERRIGILERKPGFDPTGYLRFSSVGTNVGDKVEVTTSGTLPFSYGLDWDDHSALGVRLRADATFDISSDSGTSLSSPGGSVVIASDVQISSADGVGIHALGGDIIINTSTGTDELSIGVISNSGNLYMNAFFGVYISATLNLQSSTHYPYPGDPGQFLLSSARNLTVLLHKDNEATEPTTSFIVLSGQTAFPRQLFRVDSDNTIHGPVGGAIIWDLV
jgi:hypothetical protein